MPARKNPLGFRQKHYGAKEIRDMFSVSLEKAYEIIHECVPFGEVTRIGGLRVSESALEKWYNLHIVTGGEAEDGFRAALLEMEKAMKPQAKRGRPRKEAVPYAERLV